MEPTYPMDEDDDSGSDDDDDGTGIVMYEYAGCCAGTWEDRALDYKLDSPEMTAEVSFVVEFWPA